MTKTFIAAAILLVSTSAYAQVTCNTYGLPNGNSIGNCSNGQSYSTYGLPNGNSMTTITPPTQGQPVAPPVFDQPGVFGQPGLGRPRR